MSENKNTDDNILDRKPISKKEEKIDRPRQWKTLFFNDDFTAFDHVTYALQKHYRHTIEEAQSLATEIHTKGQAVVYISNYEVAETKAMLVMQKAKEKGFPLQVVLMPEPNKDE